MSCSELHGKCCSGLEHLSEKVAVYAASGKELEEDHLKEADNQDCGCKKSRGDTSKTHLHLGWAIQSNTFETSIKVIYGQKFC